MTNAEFRVAYAQHLAHQRLLVSDMNSIHHKDGRLTDDYSHTQRSTGDRLDRGQAFDRHAMTLLICWEVETRDALPAIPFKDYNT